MFSLILFCLGLALGCRWAVRANQSKSHSWRTMQMLFLSDDTE